MADKRKQKQKEEESRSVPEEPKNLIDASAPSIKREFEEFLKRAQEIQDASDRAFRLELVSHYEPSRNT